jgi:hypothetical protein
VGAMLRVNESVDLDWTGSTRVPNFSSIGVEQYDIVLQRTLHVSPVVKDWNLWKLTSTTITKPPGRSVLILLGVLDRVATVTLEKRV